MKAEDAHDPGFSRLRWRLFWVGLIVRVLYIAVARTYHIRVANDHFQFGWEVGRIARSLATGYGFADPFAGHTGATSWSPPVYPLLLAGVFKLFGVYTSASAFVLLTLNSFFSAAIAPAVHEIADRCYDANGYSRRVALWSGWLWALYPAAMQYAVRWIWEMSLTTCALTWILVIALRSRGIGDRGAPTMHRRTVLWCCFGLLWGVVALSNPSLILALPITTLWMLMGSRHGAAVRTALANAAWAGILFLCCLAPWVYRNWKVFHAFIPTRGNLGAELYQSVLPSNDGFPWGTTVPAETHSPEFERYRRMGELAYVRERGAEANRMIAADRLRFVSYAFKRIYFFWFGVPKPDLNILIEAARRLNYSFISLAGLMGLGLSLLRRVPAAGLYTWIFLVLPVPYYLLTVQARFRHPLEPLLTIFIVFLFQAAQRRPFPV
jgi:hypothetical protein